MKRLAALLLLGCLLGLLLFTIPGVQAKGPIEIIYYSWDDPANKPIVDAFNASQKEIFVKATYLPTAEFETKMVTLLAGGATVDCYMQKRQPNIFQEVANGTIEPLDKYITKYKYNLEAIKPYMSQVSINGKVAAIPFRGAGYYTYYNKKLFADAGQPTPAEYVAKGQWTWDKFAEVARKMSSGDGKQYGAFLHSWPQLTFLPAIQEGVDFITPSGQVDLNSKSLLYSLRMRKSFEKEKVIIPLAEINASRLHYSTAFYNGNVAMLPMGEWFPGFMINGRNNKLLKGFTWNDYGITRLPCNTPNYITMGQCTFNHVVARSKKKDAAFKFIAWMGGPEGGQVAAKAGLLPAVIDDKVMAILAESVPDKDSLKYLTEKVPVKAQWFHKWGSKLETQVLNPLLSGYLSSDQNDGDFIADLEKGCKDLIKSTN